MGDSNPTTVAAEVSINSQGALYLGVEARRRLGVSVDDNIKVEIPEINRVYTGSLNSGNEIYVGRSLKRLAFPEEFEGATTHVDAIVTKTGGTWDDDHGLTEERGKNCNKLKSKNIRRD